MAKSKNIPRYYNHESLNLLNNLDKKKKAATCCKAISKLNAGQQKFVCQCFSDVIQQKKPFVLPNTQKKQILKRLSPYATDIKKFISPRLSYAAKRNLLIKSRGEGVQAGAGIFTGIFFCLLPLIIDLVSSKIIKK